MTKVFLKSDNQIRVRNKNTIRAFDELPAETYTVKFDERASEFYLEQIENFELPGKIYGNNTDYSKRILNTFENRPGSTGVLLSGIKGAGKTLLAKQTAVAARAKGIPTIVINHNWHGDEFNSFIQSITTPAIIMFDEFEKIYDYQTQRKILTLFDGVFFTRKLFMITTNTDRDISEFMKNRPGRVYYNFQFDTLGQDFVSEFLEDRLEDKSQIDDILKYTKVFSFFNFDMLNAVVEEMNRYGETLPEVLEVLNIKPENRHSDTYQIDLKVLDRVFVLERNYTGFQPNQFEYLIWTDEDMPSALKQDQEVYDILTGAGSLKTKGLTNGNPSNDIWGEEDNIKFNPKLIKDFVEVENKFVYAIERYGNEIELHVKRNDRLADWKYDPRAY